METFFDIALIITSIATIACVVLQNRGLGLGSLGGNEPGASVFNARRGILYSCVFIHSYSLNFSIFLARYSFEYALWYGKLVIFLSWLLRFLPSFLYHNLYNT